MGKPVGSGVELRQVTGAISVPNTGNLLFYAKDDGLLYTKTAGGVETQVGGGGTPAATGYLQVAVAASAQYGATPSGLAAIDGYTPIAGDSVLIWRQDVPNLSFNGIWTAAAGTWTRHASYDTLAKMSGLVVAVKNGTNWGGRVFLNANKVTDVLGSQNARFRSTAIQTGAGLSFYGAAAAQDGQLLFDTTANMLKYYNGTAWKSTNGVLVDTNTNRLNYQGLGGDPGLVWLESDTGRTYIYDAAGAAKELTAPDYIGTVAPVALVAGQRWFDTALLANKVYDGTRWIITGNPSVRCATTANITLSGPQTIDGISAVAGDAVLVKNQTAAATNGIYLVAAGTWTRAVGADTALGAATLSDIGVREGTVNGGSRYGPLFKATDVLGTTAMNWAEDYSDNNPPATLNQTLTVAGSVPTPAAGQSTQFSADGKTLSMKAPDGTVTLIGPSAGGGGGTAGAQFDLTTDWSVTNPAIPATGVTLFARRKAGRRLPAYMPPSGLDSALQPGIAFNKIAWVTALGNVATLPTVVGTVMATAVGTATARNVATTNFSTATRRIGFVSTATAGAMAEYRASAAQYFLSSTALMGGFYMVARFILSQATATDRFFVGMAPAAAQTNVEPSTILNAVGVGCNAADTQLFFQTNDGTGAATKTATSANFLKATTTNVYDFRMFSAPGSNRVSMSLERLDTAAVTYVEVLDIATKLPVANTLLAPKLWKSNGTTAAATAFDFISLYVETDN